MNQLRIGLLWGALLLSGVTQAQTPSPAQLGLVVATPNVVQVLDSSQHWATIGTVDATTHVFTVSGAAGIPEAPTGSGVLYGRKNSAWSTVAHTDITDWTATLTPYALLASPTFTGTPSLPTGATGVTQSPGDSSTKFATTAFVGAAVTAGATAPGGTAGQIQYKNGTVFGGFTASGDATINTGTGAVAVTKTGGVAFGGLATVVPGAGVATAAAAGANTNGGLATATTSSVVVGAINTGGGSGAGVIGLADVVAGSYLKSGGVTTIPAWQAFGAGVQAAVALAANGVGGVALVSAVPTAGNFVKWAAGGLVDGGTGSGGGTITANSTPTSGFAAGQFLVSDGTLAQPSTSGTAGSGVTTLKIGNTYAGAAFLINGAPIASVDNFSGRAMLSVPLQSGIGWWDNTDYVGTGPANHVQTALYNGAPPNYSILEERGGSAVVFRVYNSWTDDNNGEWGAFDWQTTANVLLLGAQKNGTGTLRPVQIVGSNVQVPSLTSVGTQPTITGSGGTCATTTKVGGALAGTVVLSAICATTNTIAWTGMPATANGYACDATNRTHPTSGPFPETASTTTGFTITVGTTSTTAADVLQWKCMGY